MTTLVSAMGITRENIAFSPEYIIASALLSPLAGLIDQKNTREMDSALNININEDIITSPDKLAKIRQKLLTWSEVQNGLYSDVRIKVVYRPEPGARAEHSREVITMLDQIEDTLRELKFDVIDREGTTKTDAIIRATLFGYTTPSEYKPGTEVVAYETKLRFIDKTKDRTLAIVSGEIAKDLTNNNPGAIKSSIDRVTRRSTDRSTNTLAQKIANEYIPRLKPVTLVINNITPAQERNIIDKFRADARVISSLQTNNNTLTLALHTKQPTNELRLYLTDILDPMKLTIEDYTYPDDTVIQLSLGKR